MGFPAFSLFYSFIASRNRSKTTGRYERSHEGLEIPVAISIYKGSEMEDGKRNEYVRKRKEKNQNQKCDHMIRFILFYFISARVGTRYRYVKRSEKLGRNR